MSTAKPAPTYYGYNHRSQLPLGTPGSAPTDILPIDILPNMN
jgi:hypothetical protein